ncbi:MAG: tRNA ((37)-N1)-methyltransferase TrmD, partial [Planctomycetota bacterium]
MRFDVLTLFPDMFREVLATSMPGRAAACGAAEYHLHDLRHWTSDKHRTVDDRPFGGGPGMVMMCQPLWDAVHAIEA